MSGIVCDFRLGYGRVLSRRSKIIAINRCKQQLYKVGDNILAIHFISFKF